MTLSFTHTITATAQEICRYACAMSDLRDHHSTPLTRWWQGLRFEDKHRIKSVAERGADIKEAVESKTIKHGNVPGSKRCTKCGYMKPRKVMDAVGICLDCKAVKQNKNKPKAKPAAKKTSFSGHPRCARCKKHKPGRWINENGVCTTCSGSVVRRTSHQKGEKKTKNFEVIDPAKLAKYRETHSIAETAVKFGIGQTKAYSLLAKFKETNESISRGVEQIESGESVLIELPLEPVEEIIEHNVQVDVPTKVLHEEVVKFDLNGTMTVDVPTAAKEHLAATDPVYLDKIDKLIGSVMPTAKTKELPETERLGRPTPEITKDFMDDMFIIIKRNFPKRIFKVSELMKVTDHSLEFCLNLCRAMAKANYLSRVGTSNLENALWEYFV